MNDDQSPIHQRFTPTHYQVLDVVPAADQATVRRAYHDAARRWHPDRLGELGPDEARRAENEIRKVNQAWEVLGREDRRRAYDRELARGGPEVAGARPAGVRSDDGVIRIDPRLLDPEFLAARRHAQFDEISNAHAVILRAVPLVAVLLLLGGIFVFSAYARDDGAVAASTTVAGPSLGSGIGADDCVSVLTGPALLERACDGTADGRVVGAREAAAAGACPLGTFREVTLSNGVVACLAPVG